MKKIFAADILQTIGANLHSIRNARKETLQAVASALSVSHPIISKIENGRYETLSVTMLVKLCNHYEVTLQQILSLDQYTIFQLTQHNDNGTNHRLIGQELADGYMQSIEQYKSEIAYLRKIVEASVNIKHNNNNS